jgi:hypothetical protein
MVSDLGRLDSEAQVRARPGAGPGGAARFALGQPESGLCAMDA